MRNPIAVAAVLTLSACLSRPLPAQKIAATQPADPAGVPANTAGDGTLNLGGRMFNPAGPADYSDVERPEPAMVYASCMLQVDVSRDNEGSSIDAAAISSLLSTTLLREAAAAKALGLSREETIRFVSIRTQVSGDRYLRLYAGLRRQQREFAPEAAQQLLWAMYDQLQLSLKQSATAKAELMNKAAADRDERRNKLQAEIDELNQKIAAASLDTSDLNGGGDNLTYLLSNNQQQRKSISQELTRLRRQLADSDPGNGSALAAQWQALAATRQKELDELLKVQPIDAEKVHDAAAKLADALTAQAAARSSGESAAARRSGLDVTNLKSQIADNEQRLADLDAQLKKLQDPKILAMVNDLPGWQNRRNELRNQQSNLQYNVVNRSASPGWVQVTVLGSTTRPLSPPTSEPTANE